MKKTMNKDLVITSVKPTPGMVTKELSAMRAIVHFRGVVHYRAFALRYLCDGVHVFTLVIVANDGPVYYLRIKHENTVRLFKTEEAVSVAVTECGFQTKTTIFVDSQIYR